MSACLVRDVVAVDTVPTGKAYLTCTHAVTVSNHCRHTLVMHTMLFMTVIANSLFVVMDMALEAVCFQTL